LVSAISTSRSSRQDHAAFWGWALSPPASSQRQSVRSVVPRPSVLAVLQRHDRLLLVTTLHVPSAPRATLLCERRALSAPLHLAVLDEAIDLHEHRALSDLPLHVPSARQQKLERRASRASAVRRRPR
jgi:hypothetical protein